MVPTYPEWRHGYYQGVVTTTINIFNKRTDVEYYDIGLFDENWNPVFFVADYKVIKLKYLQSASIDIYVSKENAPRVEYVCSKSKVRQGSGVGAVSSRICSRFRK